MKKKQVNDTESPIQEKVSVSKEPIRSKVKRKSSMFSTWGKKNKKNVVLFRHIIICFLIFHVVNNLVYYYQLSKATLTATGIDHFLNALMWYLSFPEIVDPIYLRDPKLQVLQFGVFFSVILMVFYFI